MVFECFYDERGGGFGSLFVAQGAKRCLLPYIDYIQDKAARPSAACTEIGFSSTLIQFVRRDFRDPGKHQQIFLKDIDLIGTARFSRPGDEPKIASSRPLLCMAQRDFRDPGSTQNDSHEP